MAASCVMKQLREKHISAEISQCLWSPKMDLIAIANVQGQVCLHRLSWQQVWILNPPAENQKVSSLAWRLDSNVLSVGYTSGKVVLVNIEDSSVIHELDLKQEVSSLSWNKHTSNDSPFQDEEDAWAAYVYPLPPLSKTFGENARNPNDIWQEPRLLQDQTDLNILSIGTVGGVLYMYAYGLFHIATINIAEKHPSVTKIVNIAPSLSLDYLSVILEVEEQNRNFLAQVNVNTSLISSRHKELRSLAQKYGQIHSLMTYIGHTLTLIEDAWENALIEMDAKLANYASTVSEEGVSADFLDLLTFGHASAEFEIFLTSKLTEKNLKELRHSVDLCYSMMQRLVVKHLQQVGITLVFLLSQVDGMSQRKGKFDALGVHALDVEKAMGCVGSFLLKSSEMLEAIESSMKDFHIFVRWVTSVHLRLLREHVPAELGRFSQQEMTCLLNFLNESFEEIVTGVDGERRIHFRLERAGQYMKNEELKCLPHSERKPFSKLVNSNPALAAHRLIFIHNPRRSLIQEHEYLTETLTKMGAQPGLSISASIEIGNCVLISPLEPGTNCAFTQNAVQETSVICSVIPNVKESTLIFLEWQSFRDMPRGGLLVVGNSEGSKNLLGMLDTQFYSSEFLSLLLLDHSYPRNPFFAQVSIQNVRSELNPIFLNEYSVVSELDMPTLDLSIVPEAVSLRRLETGLAAKIAVSGPRKVAAVIGENRRRVRIYEMEIDEDEDEEDEEIKNDSGPNYSGTQDELNDT